jgi:ATP-binding cassette, subfamily B, bacterial
VTTPGPRTRVRRGIGVRRGAASSRAVLSLSWQCSRSLTLTLWTLSLVTAVVPALVLLLTKALVDSATTAERSRVGVLVVAVGLVTAAQSVISAAMYLKREELAERLTLDTQLILMEAASSADLSAFDDEDWRDKMARAVEGAVWRPAQALAALLEVGRTLVTVASMGAVLVAVDSRIIVLALVSGGLMLLQRRRAWRAIYRVRAENTVVRRELDYLRDVLVRPEYSKEVRSLGLASHLRAKYVGLGSRLVDQLVAAHRRNVLDEVGAALLGAVCLVLAIRLVVDDSASGNLRASELFVGLTAFSALIGTVLRLVGGGIDLEEHATYLTDYFDLRSDLPPRTVEEISHEEQEVTRAENRHVPSLELREVSFGYLPGCEAIRAVNLTIDPGEFVVLMGSNGAGKSTLVKLMAGLLLPTAGVIELDGLDASELEQDVRRRIFAPLFQDYARFELAMDESIALGNVQHIPKPDLIREALGRVGLLDLVLGFPGGVHCPVGRVLTGSRDLSGGQWQRVALARIYYRDAPVWILDEPTAALDADAEATFVSQIRQSGGCRTVIIVSHRLELARRADRIVVLEGGTVVELGSHEHLLSLHGRYAGWWDAVHE